MVFKCKICGGQTTVDTDQGIVVCDYCGTKQALPLFTDESAKQLYDRGNNYLLQSEYDKAEAVFAQLLSINPKDPELYWDLVLCKFGVTYVCDPNSGKYIPTCNRTHYTPIFSDENYLKAIELSDGEKQELYKADSQTIDNIQKGIIAVSKKEKPFDIFISYKETDQNGNRTQDSIVAQNLYEKLTAEGYKVFFSRITLEDKVGTQYEPYIYSALYSSKVMLTICSSKDNVEAVWVKNEWSRFLSLRQKDAEKALIPLYFDMPKEDLPDDLSMLTSYDMKEEGFEQELLRGIKKLIPLPIMLVQKRKKIRKALLNTAIAVAALALVLAIVFLPYTIKNSKYESAIDLFENTNYEEASVIFEKLGDFKNSAEMVEKCAIQPDYDAAMQLYYDGEYAQSAWAFGDLGDYEDSAQMKKQAELSWRKILATVVVRDYDVYSTAVYYINENGTVDLLDGTGGNAHKELSIAEHGKIVSIEATPDRLYALHEDGYVSNAKELNHIEDDSQWHDIVKISRNLNCTNVALRADGTMVYGATKYKSYTNEWLEPISEWTDIVDFEVYCQTFYEDVSSALIIGVKADGTLCYVSTFQEGSSLTENLLSSDFDSILSKFSNVKKVNFECSTHTYPDNTPYIAALTKDNKFAEYINDIYLEEDATDICDVSANYCVLKTNGDLVDYETMKVVGYDVVYANDFYITRTGTIYSSEFNWTTDSYECTKTNNKACIYDEWLERLD